MQHCHLLFFCSYMRRPHGKAFPFHIRTMKLAKNVVFTMKRTCFVAAMVSGGKTGSGTIKNCATVAWNFFSYMRRLRETSAPQVEALNTIYT